MPDGTRLGRPAAMRRRGEDAQASALPGADQDVGAYSRCKEVDGGDGFVTGH